MTKTIKIKDKEYTIRELLFKDIAEFTGLPQSEVTKKTLINSTGITEDEYNKLSIQEGAELMKAINELNSLDALNFQKPTN